jgi:hypothetical protein
MELNPTEHKKKRRRHRKQRSRDWTWLKHAPLAVFGLIALLAPILF